MTVKVFVWLAVAAGISACAPGQISPGTDLPPAREVPGVSGPSEANSGDGPQVELSDGDAEPMPGDEEELPAMDSQAPDEGLADRCDAPNPGEQDLRRLSAQQFAYTVAELLPGVTQAAPFPEATVGIFDTASGNNTVTATAAFDLATASADMAVRATSDMPSLLGCAPVVDEPADGCVATFVRSFGARAFRRPLSEGADGEFEALFGLYRTLRTQEDDRQAVAGVIEAVLQSPQLLYIANGTAEVDPDSQVVVFDDHTLASRLSYFLWNSPPDDALLAAAAAGELRDLDLLAGQARRMLDDPRARQVVRSFHRQWLNLRPAEALQRDPGMFPAFGPSLLQHLYSETDRLVDHVVWDANGTFSDLMTDRTVFANDAVQTLYGLPVRASGPDDWQQESVPERAGLLSRGAFLANHAHVATSSPIQRGVFVIRRLLCQPINVPDNVDTSAFEPGPSQGSETVRDKLAHHREDPSCAGCHDIIDPIGLAFEHFDAVGGYRSDYDNGMAVDATGTLQAPAGDFDNAAELVDLLAADPQVQTCYAQQWLSYAIGRNVDADDACSVEALRARMADGDLTVQELLIEVTQTAAFRYRRRPELVEEVGQ